MSSQMSFALYNIPLSLNEVATSLFLAAEVWMKPGEITQKYIEVVIQEGLR